MSVVVVVERKDEGVVVPWSEEAVPVVVAPLSVDGASDDVAVASVVVVVELAGTTAANATELDKPTTTTAKASARRVLFSSKYAFTMLLPLHADMRRRVPPRHAPAPCSNCP